MIRTEEVAAHLAAVHRRIEGAGGDPARVAVVAVTKQLGPDAIEAALGAGLVDLGENHVQALVARAAAGVGLPDPTGVRWHLLGPVQRNKVAAAAPHVALWQAVDRVEAGAEIARRAPGAAVLVQVRVVDDPSRPGVDPTDVPTVVGRLRSMALDVRGLMAVAAVDPAAARHGFRTVAGLADDLGLEERSMGMSDDFELAVAEGSTMVRLGRALFGPRPGAN